ncbi:MULTISPECIES: hypothetical protein [Streptomyces]|uniref:Uncharacterized protein n=2 Tax=Streptomyces TaxID=1883 RepID=A0A646KAQ9_STRJU|nr:MULTISPECIES: hypothetical protein [Streptomyces]MQS34862.1 hypothetical protein [Streptomyces katsurahamanus]MQS98986.1 hypothetical protein [Streptomyces jumonjinensis]
MHSYDPRHQLPYQSHIPAMRPAHEMAPDHSLTPIYETLCAEYRRAFRTLPGDRSGEEDLGFRAFGAGPAGNRGYGAVTHTQYPGMGWQPYPMPRPHMGHHPAALPPAPRRGI